MARTKKTAQILRTLQIQAATSSSISDSDSLPGDISASMESFGGGEAAQDDIPYAKTQPVNEEECADLEEAVEDAKSSFRSHTLVSLSPPSPSRQLARRLARWPPGNSYKSQ
ncbi:hypothetical protein V7S43_014619 [Phytophthora oleae]|uniref:Uncharacterized protein n=1 Tax=Phytophthora oleae TaxID=2107226 RepID=A0ABD3F1W7_9STRA